ncbi:MAG: TatD family hydrolase [Spirochaetota bacterium]
MVDQSRYFRGSIDSHAHIGSLADKGLDPEAVLTDVTREAMGGVIDIGIEPDDLEDRLERFGAAGVLWFTAGLHPTAVRPEDCDAQLELLGRSLQVHGERIVAVGELGLDFYWSQERRALQLEALERQAALAREHGLPIVVHNRESEDELLAFLERMGPNGVMHCFTQGPDYCRKCLDLGMYISFGGNITYRNSDEVREAAKIVPADRLLVETDSPYLSPQVVRGTPNHPGHLGYVIEALAEIRADSADRVAELTAKNAMTLFALKPSSAA